MLALWFVGGAIEMSHGWLAALVIFSFSAVGGTILSAIFLPEYISVGASGGVFGGYHYFTMRLLLMRSGLIE